MVDLTNSVNPLSWNVPIVDSHGNPTQEFQRKWEQQARTNASIPDLTTAAAVSAVLDEIGATRGSLLSRGASQWGVLAIGGANTILKSTGTDPAWSSLSSLMDTLGSARGDVLFRGAAGWTVLIPGTAGNVLTTAGAGADPSWTTPASGGGGAASIQDDGTNLYVALSDTDGQLVLDGSGDPVFSKEVLPPAAIPIDGATVANVGGLLTAVANKIMPVFSIDLNGTDQTPISAGATNLVNVSHASIDTRGWFDAANHRWTPQLAGNYLFIGHCSILMSGQSTANGPECQVFKNGALAINGTNVQDDGSGSSSTSVGILAMNGTTDFVDLRMFIPPLGTAIRGAPGRTSLSGVFIPATYL